jgi:RHS repeat-associated protein
MRWICSAFLPPFMLFASFFCRAQVVDPTTAAQRPIPGSAHDYIGIGSEIVNPADGTISFNLPIQTPAGRQLSLPFSIRFNSAEPFYLTNNGASATFNWLTPTLNGIAPPFSLNGWAYSLPSYIAQASAVNSVPEHCSPSSPCNTYNSCWAAQGYSFNDLDGVSHTLNVANAWLGPSSTDPYDNVCDSSGFNGFGGYSGTPFNGITNILGTATPAGTGTQPALTVTDKSGTVYQFPQVPAYGGPFGNLAQSITDRNGNQIVLNGTSGLGSSGILLPAGGYKDTAGRQLLAWSGIGNATGDQITVSGLSSNIVVKWKTISVTLPTNSKFVSASFGTVCGFGRSPAAPISMSVVSEIDLPNNTKYTFAYGGAYGLLTQINFPDGGYVRYVWGPNTASRATFQSWILDAPNESGTADCWALVDTPAVTDRYVSFSGSETVHQHFTYTSQFNTSNPDQVEWTTKSTTVTNTDTSTGLVTVTQYAYVPFSPSIGPNDGPHTLAANASPHYVTYANWQANQVPVESQVVTKDNAGKTYQTVNKQWLDQYTMLGEQTILDNGQGMTTLRCADSADNITAVYEYNFQSAGAKPADPTCTTSNGLNVAAIGPLLRRTTTVYHPFTNTNILNEPDYITMTDGSGSQIAKTVYYYDQIAVISSGTQQGLVSPPGLRGNATTVYRWLNTSTSSPPTSYVYFDTGQIQSKKDPCGSVTCVDMKTGTNKTTYGYQDKWYVGSFANQTNAYLTSVTDALSHTLTFQYDYTTGRLGSATDVNSKTTTLGYNDPLLRLKDTYDPASAQNGNAIPHTSYTYTDGPSNSTMTSTGPTGIVSLQLNDGFDRPTRTELTSDPGGIDYVDTTYDGEGNKQSISNPYRSTTDLTYGITSYLYDPLNRKTTQCQPDNTAAATPVCTPAASYLLWTFSGNTVTYRDEIGNQWKRTNDALGRLIQVLEPTATSQIPTLETDYSYDLLNNLVGVNQHGTGTDQARVRSFTYDSLSRLICASNPENSSAACPASATTALPSGVVSYSYDANGNLTKKTDARGTFTNYGYDALNRLTSKTYSDTSPSVVYNYDETTLSWGSGLTNTIGRLSSESVGGTNTYSRYGYSYDEMGRIIYKQFQTPNSAGTGVTSSVGSSGNVYDLAGNVTFEDDGVGVQFTETRDLAGHVKAAIANKHTTGTLVGVSSYQLFANATYSPSGAPATRLLGNGLSENLVYDKRLRVQSTAQFQSGSAIGYSTSVTYQPNGNVNSSSDVVNGNWTYTYDDLNRLHTATSAAGLILTWGYDSFGNRLSQSATGTGSAPQPSFTFNGSNNHADAGFVYDLAGNIKTDNFGQSYTYDAESRITSVGSTTYKYDAEGQLVYESGPHGVQVFLRNPAGQATSINNPTACCAPYAVIGAYIDGKKVGSWQHDSFHWTSQDWLGTKRYETGGNGDISSTATPTIQNSFTSLPFGDGLSSIGTDPTHFTNKERDIESGNDYFGARYYSSSTGRFMSPDWAAKAEAVPYSDLGNPQSLNLYVYVNNNPLSKVDSDGHEDGDKKDRLISGATGVANLIVAAYKGISAINELAASPATDGLSAAFATYDAVQAVGGAGAGLTQIGGAISGNTSSANAAADGMIVSTSIAGTATLAVTKGNMDAATKAAAVEGLVSTGVTRSVFKSVGTMVDTVMNIQTTAQKPTPSPAPAPKPPAPTPPAPKPPPPPKKDTNQQ